MEQGMKERIPVIRPEHGMALLRILMGVLFLSVYIENLHKGLYSTHGYRGLIEYYITKGHSPEAWKAIMRLVAANAVVFAPIQGVTELMFGLLLTTGTMSRVTAFGAFGLLTSLWVSEWGTGWIWELLIPMGVAFVLALAPAGRIWGFDSVLHRKFPQLPIW